MRLLTKDHSLVQELIDSGQLSDIDAKTYPYKNVITRAIGISEHVDIDFTQQIINRTDKVLLCSDGLTNFISENEIFRIVSENSPEEVAGLLIDAANLNGGGDNVTAVVFSK